MLSRPFDGTFAVTQVFAHDWPGVEPAGFRYPDGSIGYTPGDGGVAGNWHNGVDYATPCGTPLLAAADGVVSAAGWDTTGFGNRIILDHGDVLTLYAHLNRLDVQAGQQVKAHEQIGLSGSSGNSTGCHLHFSVMSADRRYYYAPDTFFSAALAPFVAVAFSAVAVADLDPPLGWYGQPSARSNRLGGYKKGQQAAFVGWQRGDQETDLQTHGPDNRWFKRGDGAWTASAWWNGNPPDSTPL
jgi:murein DD-endopeptidase MepM/ murein hydrolase activator NlpD